MSIFVRLVHEAHPFGADTQNRSRQFCRDCCVSLATASGVALPPASMQSSVRCTDAHGCANAAKTWMSKSGLTLTPTVGALGEKYPIFTGILNKYE